MVALAGCGASDAAPADDVMVNLASVTLGDDCGGTLPPPDNAGDATKKADKQDRSERDSDAKRDSAAYNCRQTSMQLSLVTNPKLAATAIKIKKVELLDDKGKLLETLTASKPSRWNGKAYETWTESVKADERFVASYLLTSPTWSKVTGGRRAAASKKFELRVTLDIGGKNKAIDKKVSAAAYIEPDVDT